jgi:hypothetical protein
MSWVACGMELTAYAPALETESFAQCASDEAAA